MSSGPEPLTAATRAAVHDHADAFNAHDTDALIAGLHPDVEWVTGNDTFCGPSQLRDVFDEEFWAMQPSLTVLRLVVEADTAAAMLHETLVINGEPREFDIAAFFTVTNGRIRAVRVYRAGSADIEAGRDGR